MLDSYNLSSNDCLCYLSCSKRDNTYDWHNVYVPRSACLLLAKLLAYLYNNGYAIALFGSLSDIDATETFKKNFNSAYYDFASKTSLKELPAFLSAMDLLLVNDSGSMHIAIAAGVPCIAIFGPTVKELGFFPYDKRSVVLENNNLLCRPCGRHGGKRCPQNHFKCMKDINPEIVAETAVNMLKRKQ